MTLDEALDEHDAVYTKQTGITLAMTALQYYRDGMIGDGSFVEAIKEIFGTHPDVPAAVFEELLTPYQRSNP